MILSVTASPLLVHTAVVFHLRSCGSLSGSLLLLFPNT